MIVTLRPRGREEYALSTDGPPVYSSTVLGGYERAEIRCEPDDTQRIHARGATLRIHGQTGIVWQGIVTRRPGRDEPLIALGWGWCATEGRREALFCDTRTSEWSQVRVSPWLSAIGVQAEGANIRFPIPAGSFGGYTASIEREIPPTTSLRLSFTYARPVSSCYVQVYVADGGVWKSVSLSENTAGAKTVNETGTALNKILIGLWFNAPYNPAADTSSAFISDLKLYGVAGVTSATTHNVFDNVVDNEIDDFYLPAGDGYRAWIQPETTVIEPCVYPSSDAAFKFTDLTKHVAFDYGWYTEMVAGHPFCVPHWTQRPTTPDYIIRLADAEGYDIDEASLDELASAIRVNYQRADGKAVYTDVDDPDDTHPLVRLAMRRFAEITVPTASATTAATVGALAASEQGREQVKGSVTTREMLTATGAAVYLPDVRPGATARVMGLPDGMRDCTIRRITCRGEEVADIELDNAPYRLELVLALLAKRQQ